MTLTRRSGWLLALGFWSLCGLISGLQIWIGMLSHKHYVPLLLGYQVLVWNGWLLLAPLVRRLVRVQPLIPPTVVSVIAHLFAALGIAIVHSTWWAFLMVALRPYDVRNTDSFVDAWTGIAYSGLPLELLIYCGVVAAHYAIDYYTKYRERELEASELQRSLYEARLHALELQLQPHFLFNTLNAISSLVRAGRPNEATVMIAGLSDLLRYTLDHAGEQRVAFEDEVGILQRYLEIQHARFADRLTYEITIDDDVKRAAVPTLILQPLAENAIRHGVSRSAAPGRVELRAFRDAAKLRIELFNTGSIGGNANGIGLSNTAERLRQLYGDDHDFELREDHRGVVASLAIPWSEVP